MSYPSAEEKTKAPYFSDPVEIVGELYSFKPIPLDTREKDYHQPWSGFDPACTLEDKDDCRSFPVQTANIKTGGLYSGIEVEGDKWMRMACETAKKSVENGGGPFGAVILQIDKDSGSVLRHWTNRNQVTLVNDPTAHAEVMAIRSACRSLGVFNLGRIEKDGSRFPQPGGESYCVIYSSAEPCPMCYSAICWANIPMLFFAATRFDCSVQGVNFSDEEIYDELSKPYSKRTMKVYQCTTDNSLDAFNLWKRSPKIPY
jgi:tRNA(Arg) A34 adenosine deaminase TadA